MLAGVGGWTVAEAKERVTYAEFLDWMQFRERRGTLNLGMRMEFLMARLTATMTKDASFQEILRHHDVYGADGDDVSSVAKIMGVREVRKHG